jgi:hypothetical protein
LLDAMPFFPTASNQETTDHADGTDENTVAFIRVIRVIRG